jgi:hypothetical protein
VLGFDLFRTRSLRVVGIVAVCALAALLVSLATPSAAHAARVRCAGTFRVLHDDHVGRLSLPRGNYRITILASGRPHCIPASRLFTRFLEDFDGRLPGGWRVAARTSTFLRAPGVGFHVDRVGRNGGNGEGGEPEPGGGGQHPLGGSFCPAPFRVLHNDRIGPLRIPRGDYWIVLLQRGGLNCGQATSAFVEFLERPDGHLPPPWLIEPQTASFLRGSAAGVGFRVKPVGPSR